MYPAEQDGEQYSGDNCHCSKTAVKSLSNQIKDNQLLVTSRYNGSDGCEVNSILKQEKNNVDNVQLLDVFYSRTFQP